MKNFNIKKPKLNALFFVGVIVVMIMPKSRQYFQIILHKGISYINPVRINSHTEILNLNNHNWLLFDENNQPYPLKNIQDKVVLINFWATWCPPCIAEMPSLQQLYDAYKSEVVFLFVTTEGVEEVQQFKEKNNYTFPIYFQRSNPTIPLETTSIPRTLILNSDRKISIDKTGAVNWFSDSNKALIDQLIAESRY